MPFGVEVGIGQAHLSSAAKPHPARFPDGLYKFVGVGHLGIAGMENGNLPEPQFLDPPRSRFRIGFVIAFRRSRYHH